MRRQTYTSMPCKPAQMANSQPVEVITRTLEDMRADILALHCALADMIRIADSSRHLIPGARDALITAADQYRPLLARV